MYKSLSTSSSESKCFAWRCGLVSDLFLYSICFFESSAFFSASATTSPQSVRKAAKDCLRAECEDDQIGVEDVGEEYDAVVSVVLVVSVADRGEDSEDDGGDMKALAARVDGEEATVEEELVEEVPEEEEDEEPEEREEEIFEEPMVDFEAVLKLCVDSHVAEDPGVRPPALAALLVAAMTGLAKPE